MAEVTNSNRNTQELRMPDVANSGLADEGIVGVNITRFAKRVDSECCAYTLRVARYIDDGDRKASAGSTFSDDSSAA